MNGGACLLAKQEFNSSGKRKHTTASSSDIRQVAPG
jgi:hypothetical protein